MQNEGWRESFFGKPLTLLIVGDPFSANNRGPLRLSWCAAMLDSFKADPEKTGVGETT